ncbi:MAG: lysophospholipase [Pseudomonadota bacterium]
MHEFTLIASDGHAVACYAWPHDAPKGAIHIAHGMGEHARRYDEVARALVAAGYAVVTNDHRGHGRTAGEVAGYMGADGWNRCLADAYELNQHLQAQYPQLPRVLLGHSMGAMLSAQYITRHGASIDALILSGSPGFKATSWNPIPGWMLGFEHWRLGPAGNSALMQKALFGSANKTFEGGPGETTGYEWLSRDPEQVRAYVEDPDCGAVLAVGSLRELFAGAAVAADPASIAKIPKALPIYVFSGGDDPIHGEKQDIERMVSAWREAGLTGIELKWYDEGRHEMFKEINRDAVITDTIAWLDGLMSKLA